MRDLLPKKPGKQLTVTIEPIRGLPVEKDLVVDMEPFFDAYRRVKPYLITSGNPPDRERIQSQKDRERYDDTTKCILCACCTTSCPVFWNEGSYFGPAAIVNAHRFIFDSRDAGAEQRLEILNEKEGVWRCRTTFNCTDACPRGIEVTKAIQEVKQALIFRRVCDGSATDFGLEVDCEVLLLQKLMNSSEATFTAQPGFLHATKRCGRI
jgi:succinate dehydrogenase / fumarate reductase iron-sulfur subunit